MSEGNFQIHQIMPVTIPMQAVFYDPEEMELVRQDVICLAVVYIYPEAQPEKQTDKLFGADHTWSITTATPIPESYVVPMVGDREGYFCDPSCLDGFLGIEYNGKEESWDEAIRELTKDEEVDGCNCGGWKRGMN